MLNPEENRQRCSARRGGEREQPRRRGGRPGDGDESRTQCGGRKPTGAEVFLCPHGGDNTIHVYAGRVSRREQDEPRILISGVQLQPPPARNVFGGQPGGTAQPLGRLDRFLCRLAGDVQDLGEAQNELRPIPRAHDRAILKEEWHAQVRRQTTVATYGYTIFLGSTTRSNSASVTKPSCNAAALRVRSLSMAW